MQLRVEGKSNRQIAQHLGKAESTVREYVRKGQKMIREKLEANK